MIYVSDRVGKADDIALLGISCHIGVTKNAVSHGMSEIKSLALFFKHLHHTDTLLVVLEAVWTYFVQDAFTAMPEGGMSEIVTEGDSFGEIFVKTHTP